MRVCLLAPAPFPSGGTTHSVAALAALLAEHHEVTVIHSGEGAAEAPGLAGVRQFVARPSADLRTLKFACGDHLHAAAVVDAIRELYPGGGPGYLEAPDFRAHGLVALQARLGGEPLLAETTIAVRVSGTSEIINLHDGALSEPGMRVLADLEREQLRLADLLLGAPGDSLDLYRRFYHDLDLPEQVELQPVPAALPVPVSPAAEGEREGPLRLLYLGELSRRGGVLELVEACFGLPGDEWELTLVGADTRTATMGQSVRLTLEAIAGEDPRLRLADPGAGASWGEHDLLVCPARFEPWGEAAVAALRAGLPVLATPVGGLVAIVEDGVSGWLTAGVGTEPLRRALARLLGDRGELARVRDSGAVRARGELLADPAPVRAGYELLLRQPAAPAPAAGPASVPEPLVTGVVPYFHAAEYVGEAVASLLAQTHRELEVLIVNDGSFDPADAVLEQLAADPRVRVVTQLNGGESAARRLGALLADGEFVVMLDADNLLEPTFVERALATFRRRPDLGYVGCWLRMIEPDGSDAERGPGYAPLGNGVLRTDDVNWDGDTLSLTPRRQLVEDDLGFDPESSMHSDWELYRSLRDRGRIGTIIPERLGRYRLLPDSLMRAHSDALQRRGWEESRQRNLLRRTRWVAGGADV